MKKNNHFGKIFLITSILFIINNHVSHSQSDYREGFIINNNMDTTKGYIDYNSNQYYSCKFKRDLRNSKEEEYKPTDLFGYRFVNEKFYISKKVSIQKSYTKNEETYLKNNWDETRSISKVWYSDSGKIMENVFLEYLIKGKLNVYFYKDGKNQSHYFVSKDNDSLIDLTPELIMIYENGNIFSQEYNTSNKGKLMSLMSEYPQLQNEIQNSNINHRDLIKVAKDYHQYICNDNNCIIYAREVKKTKIKYAITLGAGYSETSRLEINSIINTKPTISPLFADNHYLNLGVDLHILNYLPQMERTSFKIGIDFFRNNYANNYNLRLVSKDTSINRYYDSYNICLNIRLIQNIFTSQNTPYFGVGFSGLYSFLESYHDYKYTNSLFNNSISNSLNQFQFGVNLSLGYQWSMLNSKLFNIEFQYKKFLSKQFNAYIILGYEF